MTQKRCPMAEILRVRTPTLEIGYEAHGDAHGVPVILLHGFPDDARAWDDVARSLAAAGFEQGKRTHSRASHGTSSG